ncbi:hypothetical protein J5X84_32005 [Streptosporangiaceae bacterium NEAU-GS5]|nr:hypothetical protein [Streptosporangiaceae bacterium NEAU-GS5]
MPISDVLRDAAAGSTRLLIVDDCEHMIADAAELIAGLNAFVSSGSGSLRGGGIA